MVAAYLRHYSTNDDALFWAWEGIQDYVSEDPSKAWELTLQLIAAASDSALGYFAAGPLQDPLSG